MKIKQSAAFIFQERFGLWQLIAILNDPWRLQLGRLADRLNTRIVDFRGGEIVCVHRPNDSARYMVAEGMFGKCVVPKWIDFGPLNVDKRCQLWKQYVAETSRDPIPREPSGTEPGDTGKQG